MRLFNSWRLKHLSQQALIAWADYVLDICLDQVGFMTHMLDFKTLMARLEACLVFEATVEKSGVRQESLRGLHYLFLSGEEMARGDFKAMLGMSDRAATDALGRWSSAVCSKLIHLRARCVLVCRSVR